MASASVGLSYKSEVTVTEVLDATTNPAAEAAGRTITHKAFNSTQSLSASTTPPVTKVAAFNKALAAGAATIDLTALLGTNGVAVDCTGLKVQVVKLKAKTTNTAVITVSEGASNGYAMLGASFTFKLLPGQEITIYGNDATPDVAGADKTLDMAGTGTESLDVIIVAG